MIELSQNWNSVCSFLPILSDFQSTCHSDRTAHFKVDLQECMAKKSFEFTLPPQKCFVYYTIFPSFVSKYPEATDNDCDSNEYIDTVSLRFIK